MKDAAIFVLTFIVAFVNVSFGLGWYAEHHHADELRAVINVQAEQLKTIDKRCAINRLDGSATCPVGTFAVLRKQP